MSRPVTGSDPTTIKIDLNAARNSDSYEACKTAMKAEDQRRLAQHEAAKQRLNAPKDTVIDWAVHIAVGVAGEGVGGHVAAAVAPTILDRITQPVTHVLQKATELQVGPAPQPQWRSIEDP